MEYEFAKQGGDRKENTEYVGRNAEVGEERTLATSACFNPSQGNNQQYDSDEGGCREPKCIAASEHKGAGYRRSCHDPKQRSAKEIRSCDQGTRTHRIIRLPTYVTLRCPPSVSQS